MTTTHEITLRIRITPRKIGTALLLLILAGVPRVCSTADYQDISTLTTYYPQPAGTFGNPGGGNPALVVTGNAAIGRDYGSVTFGNINSGATRVFIGNEWPPTEPSIVRVQGALRVDGCIWLQNAGNPRAGGSYSPFGGVTSWRCRWQ